MILVPRKKKKLTQGTSIDQDYLQYPRLNTANRRRIIEFDIVRECVVTFSTFVKMGPDLILRGKIGKGMVGGTRPYCICFPKSMLPMLVSLAFIPTFMILPSIISILI